MGMAGYDVGGLEMTIAEQSIINWGLIIVVGVSLILGIVVGILLGRKAMKKRDI